MITESKATDMLRPLDRHHFLLRRFHSLLGLVPLGAFLTEHLITNSSILLGPEEYAHDVGFIGQIPGLLMLEIFLIWIPLGLHGLLGIGYTFTSQPNNTSYPYGANRRYLMMRVTGVIALVYILFHMSSTRWGWTWGLADMRFDFDRATITTAQALQARSWMWMVYLVGMLACVYHFANGLWTSAITWGLTITMPAQRRWGFICLALGLGLAMLGSASVWRFTTFDLDAALAAESATGGTIVLGESEHLRP